MNESQNNELKDYCHYSDLPSPVAYMKKTPMDLNISDDDDYLSDDDDYLSDDDDDDSDTHFDDDDY